MVPKLSVILPFYDEVEYLGDAIVSVRAQGVSALEIIVVNDNPARFSDDKLSKLIGDSGVEILSHPENLGLACARNTGLAAAKGDWIAFLDADDYYLQGGLADQLALAIETEADLVHGQALRSDIGTPDATLVRWDRRLFSKPAQGRGLTEFPAAQFIPSSWSSLYRRAFLEAEGLRFDPEQRRFEDRLFVLQAVSRAKSMAFLGQPVRIWRGRSGSISVENTTQDTRLLQMQLLEKCLNVAEDAVRQGRVPQSFLDREKVNTLWRIIWDLDLLDVVAGEQTTEATMLRARLTQLLQRLDVPKREALDPLLQKVTRVGRRTRRGTIGAASYRKIVRALFDGEFEAAYGLVANTPSTVVKTRTQTGAGKRLILHVGLHKTGTTFLQRNLDLCRTPLLEKGILVPQTGQDVPPELRIRPDAHSGHMGLFRAVREGKLEIFQELKAEISATPCETVLLSCENMLFPYLTGRAAALEALFAQLGGFSEVQVVAMARRPDRWLDAYYREWVLNGARGGARGFDAFARDYGLLLLDWPSLFAPFEAFSGQPVRLADYDALHDRSALWPGFQELCGLDTTELDLSDLPDQALYPTPSRKDVAVGELIAALEPRTKRRVELLRGYFAQGEVQRDANPISSPETRLRQIELFEERSGDFARSRGYAFDAEACAHAVQQENWSPAEPLDGPTLRRLARAGLFLPVDEAKRGGKDASASGDFVLQIRLRPWAARLLRRMKSRLRGSKKPKA